MQELRTLSLVELLDHAWKNLRVHFKRIYIPFAVLIVPALFLMHGASNYLSIKMLEVGETADIGQYLMLMGGFFLGLLVISVWSMLVYRSMMISAIYSDLGEEVSWQQAMLQYLQPKFWATDMLAGILIFFGFLACIIPGILLTLAWSVRLPVMVREERFGMAALSRSWELLNFNPSKLLSRHPLLKALAAFAVTLVLSYSIMLVVQLPVSIWAQYITMREAASGNMQDVQQSLQNMLWITLPFGILTGLGQLAINLYTNFILVGLYSDQRKRREGSDIAGRLDELVQQTAPVPEEWNS